MTEVAIADPAPPTTAGSPRRKRRMLESLAVLFPTAHGRPVSRRDVAVSVAVVVVATVVSLLRVTGTGALQSIWQEDANDLLTQALYRTGAKTLVDPMNGYYVILPRILGLIAAFLPVSWAAAVLSTTAALVLGLMVLLVYIASGAHFTSQLARLMVTVPLLIAPIAENYRNEIYNRPVCLHLFALYLLFWVILWMPTKRIPQVIAVGVAALAAFSTIVTIVFIPLALLRVIVRRDRTGVGILGMLVAGAAANFVLMQRGTVAARGGVMYPDPLVALWDYVIWGLPSSMLGYRATSGLDTFHFPTAYSADTWGAVKPNLGVIILSWIIVLVIIGVAASRRLTKPAWLLAGVAFAHSIALLCLMVMAQGNELRYLLPVELLLFTGLTVLLLPSQGRPTAKANAPLVAFAVFIVVVAAFNFRWNDTYRANAPVWTDQVAKATAECKQRPELREVLIRSAPEPWGSVVHVPCHRLTEVRPWDCPDPRCANINGRAVPDALLSRQD